MPLEPPAWDKCFVDANILYYYFVETPPLSEPCTNFLERVAKGEIVACASIHILSEAVHKVVLAEAAANFGLNRAGLVNWLQNHRDRIAELTEFRQAAAELMRMNLRLLPTEAALLEEAAELSAQLRLLTNDATIVALMKRDELHNLATNDDDFDNIANLTVWKPR
jgi:predicted nucleic acid-binding protein